MDAFVFNAELFCEDCASATISRLRSDGLTDTGDSDDWPQGAYSNGGGEADCPQHCGACGVFLENPLTTDGDAYVREAVKDADGNSDAVNDWKAFYSYLFTEDTDV